MKAWAIARVNLVRYFRDRSSIFNVFVLPMLIVLLLGAMAGGSATPRLGFVALDEDALTTELVEGLQSVEGLEIVEIDNDESAVGRVERGDLQAAIILPAGYEQTLRSGGDADIRFVARAEQQSQSITGVVSAAVTQQATLLRTARFVEVGDMGTFDEALAVAEQVQVELPPVEVAASTAGEPFALAGLGQFDIYAQGMLILFIFLTTLSGAANLLQTRQLGVSRRMYSTPTTVRTMLAGEAMGRFTIALIQGGFIFVGTWLMFGVDWGDPFSAILTILVFAAVSSGAAMLLGALASNDQQAGGIATAVGLGFAALGGAMIPLAAFELLSDTVYQVAHVTPHAWALEAFLTLAAENGGIGDIAGFLLILVGYAALFFVLATWRLRTVLVR
jgi:ABC-2 type transport system permease protein